MKHFSKRYLLITVEKFGRENLHPVIRAYSMSRSEGYHVNLGPAVMVLSSRRGPNLTTIPTSSSWGTCYTKTGLFSSKLSVSQGEWSR